MAREGSGCVTLPAFNPFDKARFAEAVDDYDRSGLEAVRQQMRHRFLNESYYAATMVLGYNMLRPSTHGPLCLFLDTCKSKKRMEQMPRSHFKTTIVTVTESIQEIMRCNWLRNLIVGDTDTNAEKHLQKIKRHLEGNQLLRWLFPEMVWENPDAQAPSWSKRELMLPGAAKEHGEMSFDAIGAGSGVVSRHYDRIVADDLIGDDELYSETEMSKTIEWATGLESLFVPPIEEGQLDIPCTFWRTDDVYAFFETFFGHNEEAIRTGPYSYQRGELAVFRRSVIEDGKIIFPEAINEKFLIRLREVNPERYAAQYANDPYASDVAYFQRQYLRYYNWLIPEHVIGRPLPSGLVERIPVNSLHIMSYCDPHAGGSVEKRIGGTRAAVITVGVQPNTGQIFMLDCWIKKAPTNLIISEIIRQNEKWQPQFFSIEANGLQKMIKPWLEERVARENRLDVPYRPYIPKGPKDGDRRIRGLQPLFRAGQIWLQEGFHEFVGEFLAYPRGTKDGLDCFAQGLLDWGTGFDGVTEAEVEEFEENLRQRCSVATGY
jgi:hypothetical protein